MPSWFLGTGSVGSRIVMVASCWEELTGAGAGAGDCWTCTYVINIIITT